jgi:hypothetical protein
MTLTLTCFVERVSHMDWLTVELSQVTNEFAPFLLVSALVPAGCWFLAVELSPFLVVSAVVPAGFLQSNFLLS